MKWLKEPLLHFLALGCLIFLLFGFISEQGVAENEIFISRGQQENLLNTFSRTWQRMPTPAEYQGLIKDYIRQEIAYRESREMGLDQDDIVIRRRLRQKMEMLAEDIVALAPPTDEELQAYLDTNIDSYLVEPRMTLRHVYFSTDRRGEAALDAAKATLQALEGQGMEADIENLGDSLPLPAFFDDTAESEFERLYGAVFTEQLLEVEEDRWTGPIESGYGLHLVYVTGRVGSRAPVLEEVREEVNRDLMSQRRRDSVDGLYQALAENYTIEIEPLTDTPGEGTEAQ